MLPISPNKNIQSSSTPPSSNSLLPNILAQIDSIHAEEDAKAESVVQISTGLVSIPVSGSHHQVAVHYHGTQLDRELLEILLQKQTLALQTNTAPLAPLGSIEELQKSYLKSLQEDDEIRDALTTYVTPECISIHENTNEHFNLEEKVKEFLASEEKQVLLLLGDAGSGKSTFNRYLARSLWKEYSKNADANLGRIPLFIPLWKLDNPHINLIFRYLESQNFSREQILTLQNNHQFIFILDGYDEIKEREHKFYAKNQFGQWKAKVIISSRPEYLGENYRNIFHPPGKPQALQEYKLAPLSERWIKIYINKYVVHKLPESERKILIERLEIEGKEILESPKKMEGINKITETLQWKIQKLKEIEESPQENPQDVQDIKEMQKEIIEIQEILRKNIEKMNKFLKDKNKFIEWLGDDDFIQGEGYTDKYLAEESSGWNSEKYKSAIKQFNLTALINNPFLLKIALKILPKLNDYEQTHTGNQIFTRVNLYEKFVQNWFERSDDRLKLIQLKKDERKAFNCLNEEGFVARNTDFIQRLALTMNKAKVVTITYPAANHNHIWKSFLGNENEETKLLRFNAPLSRQGNQYRFIHKTLQDYFVAQALWEELKSLAEIKRLNLPNELSFVKKDIRLLWQKLDYANEFKPSLLFNELNITKDPAVQSFLLERLQQNQEGLKVLLGWIKSSKVQAGIERAAANAITLLVKAGVYFNRLDLSQVKVPGADLSYGLFDHTRFQDADLKGVNWTGAWLRGVNLNGANLADLELGERPILKTENWINTCCYSPDGRWLATSEGQDIQLYKAEDLQKIHTYTGHKGRVNNVAFSPDSQWLASGGDDNTVKLWYVSDDRSLAHTYMEHEGDVKSVAFSPNGQWLASGSRDETVKLWDVLGERTLLHTYAENRDEVNCLAFSPDSQWLAAGFRFHNQTIKLWNVLGDRSLVHTYAGHEIGPVESVTFSHDGKWLASGGYDKTVKLWHVSGERTLVHTYTGYSKKVTSVAFSPDGQWLASGSQDKSVKLWRVSGERFLVHTYTGHSKEVTSIAFSPDGQWLASSAWGIKLWSISGVMHIHAGHESEVNSVAFSSDGHWLASGSDDHTVKLWNVSDNKFLAHTYVGHKGKVKSIAFSPNGQWLASGSSDNSIKLWHVSGDRSLEHTYALELRNWLRNSVNSVAFSADGQWLASGGDDNTVKLWNILDAKSLAHTYVGHESSVNSVAFSPDGQWLASGSDDETVKLWSVSDDRSLVRTYVGHEYGVNSVAFSPDSQRLASGSRDSTIKLWATSGARQLIYTYTGHHSRVESVAFSSNGQWLASGSSDNTVRLWPVVTDGFQITLQNITANSLQKRLLSAVDYGLHEALLGLVGISNRRAVLKSFVSPVNTVAWQPNNGAILSTAGTDGTLRLWRVSYGLSQVYTIALDWASKQDTLTARGALIRNAHNLSAQNKELLIQHNALRYPFEIVSKRN